MAADRIHLETTAGVRPSSGAAAHERGGRPGCSEASVLAYVSELEDGRTPARSRSVGAVSSPGAETRADLWHLIDSGAGDYACNMALDEALLEAMPRLGKAVLRFYGWKAPAASFGYFQ